MNTLIQVNGWLLFVVLLYMLVSMIVRDALKVRAWRRRQGPRP